MSAAMSFAAAFGFCCVGVCAGPVRAGDDGAHFLLFSGTDLWRDGRFMHGGVLWSPGWLEREGFTFKAVISGGQYRYQSGALNNARVTGIEEEVQLLPGWRLKRGALELKFFAGLDIKNNLTIPDDPSNRLHGTSAGARVAVNLWYEPTPSAMLAGDASLTTIATGYSARLAYGWKLRDWFYVGPEAQNFACLSYRQVRVGAHLTALKTGAFEWSAAGGWASNSDSRPGAYVQFGVLMRR